MITHFLKLVSDALAAPLAAARRHALHGAVVGYIGAEVPVEILRGSGAFALRLPAGLLAVTPRADSILESSFMPAVRSVAESYLQNDFDFLQTIVFPRSNDSAQRLYYYLCEHQRMGHRGPRLLIYDLAKIPRETSLAHTLKATRQLLLDLQASDIGVTEALLLRTQRALLMRRADALRMAGRVLGSDMERVARAAGFCEPSAFDQDFADWLDEVTAAGEIPGPRLLLVGSAPPDERLHRMVEKAGGNVVAEYGDHIFSELLNLSTVDSAVSLAAAYHRSPFGPRAFEDRAVQLKQLAAASRVDGVIFWLVGEEDAYIWDVPSQRDALAGDGIGQLVLTQRRWGAEDDTGQAIETFVRSLPGATS